MSIVCMEVEARGILTPQRGGFLVAPPYPFTHALSAYTGCAYGQTACGQYCYARFLPNWMTAGLGAPWGLAVQVKVNAPALLEQELRRMSSARRRHLRIFMSTTTDPYQPLERRYQVTRHCLQVFASFSDLDLLVVQTRSPLAERDLDLLQQLPYAWLSVTIETDDMAYLQRLRGGPSLERRWQLVRQASHLGVKTQITISPCLRFTDVKSFGECLLKSGARRLVVDTVEGDGAGGERTARTPFARQEPAWSDTQPARELYAYLCAHGSEYGVTVGWGASGFCGIAPRH
ncbi:SPL family radical SAM protein [Thermogemmatispora sp.]|uniref:SPL family radical SAM protein n=1 Tax=Thermogemmatispora sp. TaxID=1968838 RepID=UPI001DEA5F79|nr:radical SAM protein [Thermogemmatispora sp.]MBX5449650.1 radical SAM protein [Thermogemmatispora sp.]